MHPVLSDPQDRNWDQDLCDEVSFSPDERHAPVHVSPEGWEVPAEEHVGSGQHEGKCLMLGTRGHFRGDPR